MRHLLHVVRPHQSQVSQSQSALILLAMSKDQDRGDFLSELKEEWVFLQNFPRALGHCVSFLRKTKCQAQVSGIK